MKPLIIANWKCNPTTLAEAKRLFNLVKKGVAGIRKAEVVICPPFIYLSVLGASAFAKGYGRRRFIALATERGLAFGSQDCFWEKSGAFTGEISPIMLKNLGVKYVIIGHSERRCILAETDEMINKKLKTVLEIRLSPILCIGETQKQRDRGETEKILREQIEGALKSVSKFKVQSSKFCIAYEPVWAIGTGNPCDVDEAQKMSLLIRKIISKIYNRKISQNIRILYGGSVTSKNGGDYVKEAGLNGLLVGGASLDAKEFIGIVKSV